jgi:hypothetical protein
MKGVAQLARFALLILLIGAVPLHAAVEPPVCKLYDVTDYSVYPDDGLDDTATFESLLTQVPDGATIHFPAGIYDFKSTDFQSDQIQLNGRTGLTLEGDTTLPSTLRFASRDGRALHVWACSGVTIQDLVIEYATPSFTQGVLVTKDPSGNRKWIDISVSSGYESPNASDDLLNEYASAVTVFEPVSRRLRSKIDQLYLLPTLDPNSTPQSQPFTQSPADPTLLRITFKDPVTAADWGELQVGQTPDLIVAKAIICHGVIVEHSSDTIFRRVTARRMPCFGLFDVDSTHSTYDHCVVDAVGDDLLSSTADGLHVNSHRGVLTITDNKFDRTGDDAITSTTQEFRVIGVHDTSIVTVTSGGDTLTVLPGDVFEFFHQSDLSTISTASVTEVVGPWWNQADKRWEYLLFFNAQTGAAANDASVDLAFQEGGTTVTGNTIRNHRGRGMLFKVSNLTIADNDISGSTYAGMAFGPEFYYDRAGFVRNLWIHGNKISDVCTYTGGLQMSGAISVQVGSVPSMGTPLVSGIARQHMNLHIYDNKIKQTGGPALLMTNVLDADVYGNDMFSSLWNPSPESAAYFGMGSVAAAVHVDNCGCVSPGCGGVTIHDNRIETTAAAPACAACDLNGSSGTSFTNNLRVFHTGFESMHHAPNPPQTGGIPAVGGTYLYNITTPSWTASEDGHFLSFLQWGLFGLYPTLPFYLDRQTTQCDVHTGKLDVPFTAPATGIELRLGASARTNSWKMEAWLIPVPSNYNQWVFLGDWYNTTGDLPTAEPPHWTSLNLTFPVPLTTGNYKVRFIRINQSGALEHLYIDDVVIRQGLIPNQSQ